MQKTGHDPDDEFYCNQCGGKEFTLEVMIWETVEIGCRISNRGEFEFIDFDDNEPERGRPKPTTGIATCRMCGMRYELDTLRELGKEVGSA